MSVNYVQKFIQHRAVKVNSICRGKLFGMISVDFDAIGQLLIIYSVFIKYEKKWEYSEAMRQLFVDFKTAYDSVRREVLYNILIECGIPLKLIRLIKMCPNETYSRVQVGKHLSDMFLIRIGLKQGDALMPLLFNFALVCTIRRVQGKPGWFEIKWYTSAFGLCL